MASTINAKNTSTGVVITPDASGQLELQTADTTRMTITSSGNVGIDTSSPTRKLDVNGDINLVSTGVLAWGGSLNNYITGNSSSNYIAIQTNNAERMRIASDGKVTFANVYATTVGATNRDLFIDSTGLIGYVSSVRESKLNIEDLSELSWLYNLNPVSFNYRKKDEDGNYTDEIDGDIQYGLIAEDVELIRKDLCFYDESEDGQILRGIQYSKLVVPMLKAIQELKAELDTVKAELAALKKGT